MVAPPLCRRRGLSGWVDGRAPLLRRVYTPEGIPPSGTSGSNSLGRSIHEHELKSPPTTRAVVVGSSDQRCIVARMCQRRRADWSALRCWNKGSATTIEWSTDSNCDASSSSSAEPAKASWMVSPVPITARVDSTPQNITSNVYCPRLRLWGVECTLAVIGTRGPVIGGRGGRDRRGADCRGERRQSVIRLFDWRLQPPVYPGHVRLA
eukprot:1184378-Prorocentrum_minimum.AAC.5